MHAGVHNGADGHLSMSKDRIRRLGWGLCGVNVAGWTLSLALWVLAGFPAVPSANPGSGTGGPLARLIDIAIFISLAVLGALVVSREHRNAIGWLLCAAPILYVMPVLESDLAAYLSATSPNSMAIALAWLASWSVFGFYVAGIPLLMLLPTGRLPSARWRGPLWFCLVGVVVVMLAEAITPGPLRALASTDNPFVPAITRPLLDAIRGPRMALLPLSLVIAVSSLVLRFHRARGEERQQLKWIAYGAVLLSIGILGTATRVAPAVNQIVYLICLGCFVAALGLAILKYRLYQVDLVISRTLLYGGLAACITVLYIAVVAGVGSLIGSGGPFSAGLSLLATAVVAVAFQPLRERLHGIANRIVYGHRATPYEVMAQFSRRIAAALSNDEILPQLAEAAARGVGARRSRVRVYMPAGPDQAVAWPPAAVSDSFDQTVLVLNQGNPVGEIAISKPEGEPLSAAESTLLSDLASQAGPALQNVRLTLSLRAQADELRASRQRIVSAQDAERRRIERDLHDGAQQYLVAMGVTLRLIHETVQTRSAEADTLVAEVQEQLSEALRTLRDLARGIYPPALADYGIVAALEAHVGRLRPVPRLESDTSTRKRRYAPEVEAAVFFCVLEALQNCAKHAAGSAVAVQIQSQDDELTFSVTDDGPGFEPVGAAGRGGLQGMSDRLAAVGGVLEVHSCPGHGTAILGRVSGQPLAPLHLEVRTPQLAVAAVLDQPANQSPG
jgi:signal transduction histidine kinase